MFGERSENARLSGLSRTFDLRLGCGLRLVRPCRTLSRSGLSAGRVIVFCRCTQLFQSPVSPGCHGGRVSARHRLGCAHLIHQRPDTKPVNFCDKLAALACVVESLVTDPVTALNRHDVQSGQRQ